MYDPKGMATNESFLWNGQHMKATSSWTTFSLPVEAKQLMRLVWKEIVAQESEDVAFAPTFYTSQMSIVDAPTDTYVVPKGWSKGSIWINGINIGRYWNTLGPQRALFVPSSFLKQGMNDIVLLELDGVSATLELAFADTF